MLKINNRDCGIREWGNCSSSGFVSALWQLSSDINFKQQKCLKKKKDKHHTTRENLRSLKKKKTAVHGTNILKTINEKNK